MNTNTKFSLVDYRCNDFAQTSMYACKQLRHEKDKECAELIRRGVIMNADRIIAERTAELAQHDADAAKFAGQFFAHLDAQEVQS